MRLLLVAVLLQLVCVICHAKALLVDKIPLCERSSHVLHDMDGDARPETICAQATTRQSDPGTVYSVRLKFTRKDISHEISVLLLSDKKLPVYPHDDYIEPVDMVKYRHPKLKTKATGMGLRLVHPEKSSVIYFWDKRKDAPAEFWETD